MKRRQILGMCRQLPGLEGESGDFEEHSPADNPSELLKKRVLSPKSLLLSL